VRDCDMGSVKLDVHCPKSLIERHKELQNVFRCGDNARPDYCIKVVALSYSQLSEDLTNKSYLLRFEPMEMQDSQRSEVNTTAEVTVDDEEGLEEQPEEYHNFADDEKNTVEVRDGLDPKSEKLKLTASSSATSGTLTHSDVATVPSSQPTGALLITQDQ